MSTYPGNTALASAVKERVLSTFQQTLALFKQGRSDEVVQGCGLILRMDPMFDPAKKLLEKAKNPGSPINVDSLLTIESSGDPIAQAKAAMAKREFQVALDITTELLTQDIMNDAARVLNEKARERMEAQPFIEQFVKKINQQIHTGNFPAARLDLEKIRSLDAEHPAIASLERSIGTGSHPAPGAGGGTSFVVDTPPSTRSTAQASDFGFTFEEEKAPPPAAPYGSDAFSSPFSTETGTTAPVTPPAGFSFDAPSAPPPPPPPASSAAGFSFDTPAAPAASGFSSGFSFDAPPAGGREFDFSTASVETSAEDQAKVQEYLADGDRAFDGGDLQQAIDIWSRIFLIDVTNEEASSRIERAKGKRRESEQHVEGLIASGIQLFDHNDRASARDRFLEVLHIDPNNTTANDYIGRINASTPPKPVRVPTVNTPMPAPDAFADDTDDAGSFGSAIPPPPGPRMAPIPSPGSAPKKSAAAPAVKRGLPLPLPAIIGIAVVLLGGLGFFAWSKFSGPSVNTAETAALFTQADSLAKKGQYDAAIAILQDVKPNDPQHDKALSQIADLQHRKAQGSDLIDGRPSAAVYNEQLATGKAAYEAHDYENAKKAFDAAARIKALPPDLKALFDTASQQVAKLDTAKSLFKEQHYADALSNLTPLALQDPQNASVKRLITDAHFNLGATALAEERLPEAIKEFDEVLKADPTDELAKRSKALAEKYNNQPKDLLYKIYVKYLPTRKVS